MRRVNASSTSSSERRAWGVRLAAGVAVLALAAALLLSQRASLVRLGRGFSGLEGKVLPAIRVWQAQPPKAGLRRGVVFGDSVVDWMGVRLAELVEAELGSRKLDTELFTVSHPWLRPIQFYYLLDEVLAGKPEMAIVEVDLRAFWAGWSDSPLLRAKDLSRLMSPRRAWRIRSVLPSEGLGLVDPWLFRLEERLDVLYLVDGVRARGRAALDRLGTQINTALRLPPPTPLRAGALDADSAREWFDTDPARHRSAIVLRELLRGLREAGVVTVLFVAPIDVERMARFGILDGLRLPERIEALRLAIGAQPGEWRDLHALLPSKDIRDSTMHLLPAGGEKVAAAVADALAPRLRASR